MMKVYIERGAKGLVLIMSDEVVFSLPNVDIEVYEIGNGLYEVYVDGKRGVITCLDSDKDRVCIK